MTRRVPAAAMLTVLAALPASASVDRSPPPGGVYRLKPGIYVERRTACETAPNAAIRQYDGRGLSTPHTRQCRARVLSRRGATFTVAQTCLDAGAGPARTFTERQVVTVRDALDFTLRTRGPAIAYRYCPAYQLPAGVRYTPAR